MDKIILLTLFCIIGSVTEGVAQLQCFVCSNCPNANLGSNLIHTCETSDDVTTTTTEETPTTEVTTVTAPTDITLPPEETTVTAPTDITLPPEETTVTAPTDITLPPEVTTETEAPTAPITTTSQIPDTTTQTTDGGPTTQTPPASPPITTTQVPVIPTGAAVATYKYREVMQGPLANYDCFVVHQQVGDTVQVNRGCVLTQGTVDQTCSVANSGVDPVFCRLCSYNECNIATQHTVSLVIVLSSFFVIFAMRLA